MNRICKSLAILVLASNLGWAGKVKAEDFPTEFTVGAVESGDYDDGWGHTKSICWMAISDGTTAYTVYQKASTIFRSATCFRPGVELNGRIRKGQIELVDEGKVYKYTIKGEAMIPQE